MVVFLTELWLVSTPVIWYCGDSYLIGYRLGRYEYRTIPYKKFNLISLLWVHGLLSLADVCSAAL